MTWTKNEILSVLDQCCESFTFPMLDNGYVYMAATRLSAFRSAADWHLAIEVFGFSPRAGIPDTNVYHFGSSLVRQKTPESFVSPDAYENYLKNNPNNESDFIYPIEEGDWIDPEFGETVTPGTSLSLRGVQIPVPTRSDFEKLGITLEDSLVVYVYELCRALADTHRQDVLASEEELRKVVPDDAELILRLDEWNHPDVVDPGKKTSTSPMFQQVAEVLETGDATVYRPNTEPNTHWSNWPDGGQL